jgi:hypothetical protein
MRHLIGSQNSHTWNWHACIFQKQSGTSCHTKESFAKLSVFALKVRAVRPCNLIHDNHSNLAYLYRGFKQQYDLVCRYFAWFFDARIRVARQVQRARSTWCSKYQILFNTPFPTSIYPNLTPLYLSHLKVCEKLEIIEKDFFGLQYTGSKGERLWLNRRNKIGRQLPGSQPYRLRFRMKFFVEPHLLVEDNTK